ncbi:MAG: GNAT family N-acetyltransferase [Prochloraceae cyanobacterium]|nr:GNAT family N-acetyltransferase [Prochloraceae cyanobacterium]
MNEFKIDPNMKNRASRFIIIRRGKSEDRKELFQVTMESIAALCAKDYTCEQLQCLLRDKTERFRQGIKLGETIFVAQLEGKIIGYSSLLSRSIGAMFVLPQYARQGVGKKLLETIEAEAIARDLKFLIAIASLTGVPFYQACGYRCLENYSLSIGDREIGSQINIPCIRMKKKLLPGINTKQTVNLDRWIAIKKITKFIFKADRIYQKKSQ